MSREFIVIHVSEFGIKAPSVNYSTYETNNYASYYYANIYFKSPCDL